MAIGNSSSSSADDDEVELEAMRKEDSSWHPCKVSLSFSGIGLIVNYGGDELENIIFNEEEAFTRVRIRSIPLQGDDCSQIKQGEHVLVAQQSQEKSLFFDAEVEEVLRVRHSKRVPCRCNFVIKWLHQDQHGGTSTVSASSIMKLATRSINTHTIISAFLIKLKTLDCSDNPPSPTILDDLDSEIDLNLLLEKHIEEINNSADASKKTSSGNFLGTKVKGKIQCTLLATSKVKKSNVQNFKDQNRIKKVTRSRSKQDMEMEVEDPPVSSPSIQEELSEIRSPLNPHAARAALASLMSKLPQNLEFSVSNEEEKRYSYNSGNTSHKHVGLESSNGTESYNYFTGNNSMSKLDKLAYDTKDASIPKPVIADAKLTPPTKPSRLTRSAVKNYSGHQSDNVEKTRLEEMNLHSSTNRRSTRSTAHKEKEIRIMDDKQTFQENISTDSTVLDSTKQNGGKKSVYSPPHGDIELVSTEERNNIAEKKEGIRKSCVEENKSRSSTKIRWTRSAIREDKYKGVLEATKGLEVNKVPQLMKSSCSEENISAPESVISENEEHLSPPLDLEVNIPRTAKMNTRGTKSSTGKITQTTEGKDDNANKQELKRKCSTEKQEARFSPRLKFLPRTRSQHK